MTTTTPPIISIRFRLTGAVLEYKPYPAYYQWLVAADLSALLSPAADGGLLLYELPFTFVDTSPIALLTVPALATIVSAKIHIDNIFDVPASLSLGDAGDVARLLGTGDNNPNEAGLYETAPDFEYSVATLLTLTISAPGATAGTGRVILSYDRE